MYSDINNTLKKTIILLAVMILAVSALSARQMTGTGYGADIASAKASALADLVSGIRVDIASLTLARQGDGSDGTYGTFDKKINVTSDVTLQNVRYDVRKSSTAEEKKSGKYICTASISDQDSQSCIDLATKTVKEINSLWENAGKENDARALNAAMSLILEKIAVWDSCYLTASMLGYENRLPSYNEEIIPSAVSLIAKKAEAAIASAAMDGSLTSSDTSSFASMYIDSLWEQGMTDTASGIKVSSSSVTEGHYDREWKVGEPGPAGGIIVYDKGYASDGWRYLEIATEDLPGTYTAIKSAKIVTSQEVGTGPANTEALLKATKNVSGTAALACAEYESGGYDDWFLPSKGDWDAVYDTMYSDKRLNTGKNSYWSSSLMNTSFTYGFSYKTKKSFTDTYTKKHRVRPMRQF